MLSSECVNCSCVAVALSLSTWNAEDIRGSVFEASGFSTAPQHECCYKPGLCFTPTQRAHHLLTAQSLHVSKYEWWHESPTIIAGLVQCLVWVKWTELISILNFIFSILRLGGFSHWGFSFFGLAVGFISYAPCVSGPLFRGTKAETISVSRIYREALLQLAVCASRKPFRPPGHSRTPESMGLSLFSLG